MTHFISHDHKGKKFLPGQPKHTILPPYDNFPKRLSTPHAREPEEAPSDPVDPSLPDDSNGDEEGNSNGNGDPDANQSLNLVLKLEPKPKQRGPRHYSSQSPLEAQKLCHG